LAFDGQNLEEQCPALSQLVEATELMCRLALTSQNVNLQIAGKHHTTLLCCQACRQTSHNPGEFYAVAFATAHAPWCSRAHGPTLNLGHVNVSQRKDAERLEQLPRALLETEHDAGLEGSGLTLTLATQQGVPGKYE
jgi:hypothetical protein